MFKTIQYSLIFITLVVLISGIVVQETFAQTKLYDLYSGSVSVDFSPDGEYIATGDTDGDVGLWEVSSGENIYYRSLGGVVQGVAFSPNGRYIAADGADGSVRAILLDASTGTEVSRIGLVDHAHQIHSIAFSPDGQYVAIGDDTGRAYLWDVSSRRWRWWRRTHASEAYTVAFDLDGRYLATGNNDGEASLWELNSWWTDDVNSQHIQLGGNVKAVAFSPNGKYLAADGYDGSDTNVTIYDVVSGRIVQQIDPDIYEVNVLAFSPDGLYLAVGGTDPEITIYRIETEEITPLTQITKEKTIHVTGEVADLAWSPDGDLISDGRAVYQTLLDSSKIVFESQEIEDGNKGVFGWSEGNTNGIVEVGERITFIVTLKNEGTVEAENVKGTLSTEDRSIKGIIVDGEVDYGNISVNGISPIHPVGRSPVSEIAEIFKFEIPSILTTRDAVFTLTVTADNGGPWTFPITFPIINPSNIGIAFPDDLISEEAFGTDSIYFTLKVKHPTLTSISNADVYYKNCEITLHIPEDIEAFMFPIRTRGERSEDLAKDVTIYVGNLLLPGISDLITLLDFFARSLELLDRDLRVVIPNLFDSDAGRPDTEIEYVVLLKMKTRTLKSLDITIKQSYLRGEALELHAVEESTTWNFDEGWAAAPATHPVVLSDYPPFQLLPPEVQDALLRHFSTFVNSKEWRIPKETSLLPNYPNPFNPETWIPYKLATLADVNISIYAADGKLIRQLDLGHQPIGIYQGKSRAAYWDGKNSVGESVASGVYFYTLKAGNFSATRKMLIRK